MEFFKLLFIFGLAVSFNSVSHYVLRNFHEKWLTLVINSLFLYGEILTTSSESGIRFYPEFKIFS